MIPLQSLLERFKGLSNTEKVKKQLVVEIINKHGIPITVEQVSFNKNTLYIKTNPIVKTEINLKKQIILEEINKLPGIKNISSIM
jgi:hypothetical protein